ncbi:hypothetical protein N7460_003209 [Penicillium canescens]|uniref:Uncharacterized protein n=1 Tax=Penicillium canescens TaxID=5083 RepID=A0AAD6ILD2_PENCN|nr:hypothetical protein N7460_003209 [Penicillium canescens]
MVVNYNSAVRALVLPTRHRTLVRSSILRDIVLCNIRLHSICLCQTWLQSTRIKGRAFIIFFRRRGRSAVMHRRQLKHRMAFTKQQLRDSERQLPVGTVGIASCIFTPVYSQTQAFVPAHAVYPHLRNGLNGPAAPGPGESGASDGPQSLWRAHGQPLPPQQQPQGPETPLSPPQDLSYQDGRTPMDGAPPLLASAMLNPRHRRSFNLGFEYPHPTNLAPITSAGADPGYQTHTAPSPYSYPPRPAHDSRNSSSTHGSPFPPTQPHPVPLPSQQSNVPPQSSATPTRTCTSGGRQRSGLNVHDMLNACDSTVDTAPIATCSTR